MDGLSQLLGATEDLLRRQDPQRRGAVVGWAQIMQDRGHTPPPDEFLDAIAAWAVLQSRLPLRKGGLGLPSAVDVSKPAYLGGMAVTAQFLHRGAGVNLRLTGAQFSTALASAQSPHCAQLRTAGLARDGAGGGSRGHRRYALGHTRVCPRAVLSARVG